MWRASNCNKIEFNLIKTMEIEFHKDKLQKNGDGYAESSGRLKAMFDRLARHVRNGDTEYAQDYLESLEERGYITNPQ